VSHGEVGALLGEKDEACRQLLKRARENVAAERRVFETSHEEHRRLLMAFFEALAGGDQIVVLTLVTKAWRQWGGNHLLTIRLARRVRTDP
jgi:RNA polymerase sigma-70 factor, ECF subfamily